MKEMTTYNTGKPIGSSSAKDLFDNAENLDRAVNDRTSRTWTDRLGRERVTLHAVETAVPDAIAARNGAEDARDVAVLAKDAAMVGAVTYPDEATGRAAVADGAYFKVIGSGDVAAREYRRTNASTSVLVAEYPSVVAVNDLTDEVDGISKIVSASGATSSPAFIVADRDEKVLAQINDNGQLYLLGESESVQSKLEKTNEINNGSESVFSAHDVDGKSVIQVDKKGRLFTAGARRSIQDSAASNYLFRAMRHEKAGNHLLAKYWYDVAENELKTPIFMSAVVAHTGADGAIQRIPAITKVSDGRLLCIWQQIKRPGGTGDGEGVRFMQCHIDYDIDAGTITVGERSIFEEPPGWASNLGAIQHPHLITLPSGRIICVYNVNDAASGLVTDVILNIYMRYSDDGGITWSNKTKIVDAPGTAVPRIAATGSTGDFVRIPHGDYEGRIVFPAWNEIGELYSVYSDDDGISWTIGTSFITTGYQGNESGIVVLSDSTLMMNIRTEGFYNECYAISSDAGQTWEFKGPKSNWQASNCSRSTVQASFNPDDGYSKILWSGLDNSGNYHRSDLVLRVSHDDGLTYQCQYRPVPKEKEAGYSNIKMIAHDLFAVVWESGFNNYCSMMVYIANLAEVYKNGSHY